ncbi:MAG: hypothetical protein U0587_20570 [Candidatus Binatia bacterium]
MACGCATAKLQAVHAYLRDSFPDHALRDVHTQHASAAPRPSAAATDYHIVRIGDGARPYSVVLTTQFLGQPLDELRARLDRMRLADALRTHRLVIVWADAAYPLRPSGPEHG